MNYTANVDTQEVAKFSSMADKWWDVSGPCEPLHILNPCRTQFVQQHVQLSNKQVLDVGCGAGILTEVLAKQGAHVTALDASQELIAAASQHAQASNLNINYQVATIEEYLAENSVQLDVVTCMELIEHVPDPMQLLQNCYQALKPGGKFFLSTLNRTIQSYAFGIVGAEYIFKILPKRTHEYKKFIRPAELAKMAREIGFELVDISGIKYNPFAKSAALSKNVDINYLAYLVKKI